VSGTGDWLAYGGGIALVIGGSAAFGMAMRPTGPLGRAISRYVARLDAECRFQCYTIDGRQLLGRQLVFLALSIIVCIQMGQPLLWVLPPAVVFGPWFVLRRRRKKRIERIEAQLDGWLQILSNLLRAAGGLGDACRSCPTFSAPPAASATLWPPRPTSSARRSARSSTAASRRSAWAPPSTRRSARWASGSRARRWPR